MSLRIAWFTQLRRGTSKVRALCMCAANASSHGQCTFGSFTLFPVGGPLSLDTMLQDPRVRVDILKGQSLVWVQYQ